MEDAVPGKTGCVLFLIKKNMCSKKKKDLRFPVGNLRFFYAGSGT